MSPRFRAIAIVVAIAAIAVEVIAHRHHSGSGVIGGPGTTLVATKLIQKGTSGDVIRSAGGFYTTVDSPTNQIPAGVIGDSAVLAGKVALTDIDPGEELTAADFGPAPAAVIGPGSVRRALVVRSPREIGGRITVGSDVEVWVAQSGKLREVYGKVRVLSAAGRNVALDASTTEAGKLIYLMQNKNARLVLRLRK